MGPSIYDLSRSLAALLEKGLGEPRPARPIPVLLCHPLDLFESPEMLESGTVAALYPVRIAPETRLRQSALCAESRASVPDALEERLRFPSLWVRVRYAFVVAGGSLEDQLGAIQAALRTLHDNPSVAVSAGPTGLPEGSAPDAREHGDRAREDKECESYPLRIVEDPEGWRELGLREHALTTVFEVTIPIASSRTMVLPRVVERDLEVEEEEP